MESNIFETRVTPSQAATLRHNGFDRPTSAFYICYANGAYNSELCYGHNPTNYNSVKNVLSAPTISDVMSWLIDQGYTVNSSVEDSKYTMVIINSNGGKVVSKGHSSYNVAIGAAVNAILNSMAKRK